NRGLVEAAEIEIEVEVAGAGAGAADATAGSFLLRTDNKKGGRQVGSFPFFNSVETDRFYPSSKSQATQF
ncbi:MAG: hypothetical protein V3W08_01105, partial [Candidatus Binatia bacterium]